MHLSKGPPTSFVLFLNDNLDFHAVKDKPIRPWHKDFILVADRADKVLRRAFYGLPNLDKQQQVGHLWSE